MKTEDLDEYQGMTESILDAYMLRKGWTKDENGWTHPLFERIGSGTISGRLAVLESYWVRSEQELLREINPRWRLGTPSPDAVRAHGGAWMIWCEPLYPEIVAAQSIVRHANRCMGPFRCWPVDSHGSRVRWPTDAQGRML